MAVYVDKARHPHRGMIMCHMTADTIQELETMAEKLSLKPSWLQNQGNHLHYDICKGNRIHAIRLGAVVVDSRTIARIARQLKQDVDSTMDAVDSVFK